MACRFEVLLPAAATADVVGRPGGARRTPSASSRPGPCFATTANSARSTATAADGPCPLDDELADLLERCDRLSAATDGAFDITATPLSRCWRLLQRDGTVPGPDAIADARARTGRQLVEVRGVAVADGASAASGAVDGSVRTARRRAEPGRHREGLRRGPHRRAPAPGGRRSGAGLGRRQQRRSRGRAGRRLAHRVCADTTRRRGCGWPRGARGHQRRGRTGVRARRRAPRARARPAHGLAGPRRVARHGGRARCGRRRRAGHRVFRRRPGAGGAATWPITTTCSSSSRWTARRVRVSWGALRARPWRCR